MTGAAESEDAPPRECTALRFEDIMAHVGPYLRMRTHAQRSHASCNCPAKFDSAHAAANLWKFDTHNRPG